MQTQAEQPQRKIITICPKAQQLHKHTLIWIHGLNNQIEQDAKMFNNQHFQNIKVIIPQAPTKNVTVLGKPGISWFDIKFRSEKSFTVPFDQAFSSAEVLENYEKILKPLIVGAHEELKNLNTNGKVIVAGFSQGCGMSLHCFYEEPKLVDVAIGISGYLFPFSKCCQTDRRFKVLYGEKDQLRPWQYVKKTYQNKISKENIEMIPQTGHELNQRMKEGFYKFVDEVTGFKE